MSDQPERIYYHDSRKGLNPIWLDSPFSEDDIPYVPEQKYLDAQKEIERLKKDYEELDERAGRWFRGIED